MQTAIFMFQYYNNLLPKAFDNYLTFISSKHNYNTRLAIFLIRLELTITTYISFSPCYQFYVYIYISIFSSPSSFLYFFSTADQRHNNLCNNSARLVLTILSSFFAY